MLDTNNPIIKHKAGLLNLVEELGNVSKWFLLAIEKGVKAVEEGRLTDYEDIKAKCEAKCVVQMD